MLVAEVQPLGAVPDGVVVAAVRHRPLLRVDDGKTMSDDDVARPEGDT